MNSIRYGSDKEHASTMPCAHRELLFDYIFRTHMLQDTSTYLFSIWYVDPPNLPTYLLRRAAARLTPP